MRREMIGMLCTATMAWAAPSYGQQTVQSDPRVAEFVPEGKLKIGVFPSTQYTRDVRTGEPKGLAIDITRAIASRLGVAEVIPVEHTTPAAVVTCVKTGGCDLGFISVEPARTTEVDFTPPYIRRDFTYLVSSNSSIRSSLDADRSDVRIVAVRGHASTTALVRVIKQATPVYADDLDPAFEVLRTGGADAFASVREVLLRYSEQLPGSRVLESSYESSLVGVAVQKERPGWLTYVGEFLDEMKRSGQLRRAIDAAGLRGFEVVSTFPEHGAATTEPFSPAPTR